MFSFEKLDVWHEAIQFADLVYELTGDFPDQVRREVHPYRGRISTDLVKLQRDLCFKVVSQTTIALCRRMIAENDYKRIYTAAEKQRKMLNGLRRSLSET